MKMLDPNIVIAGIMALCSIVSAAITVYTLNNNKAKDSEESGARSAVMQSDLGYIKSGIDEVKKRMDKQDTLIMQILERIAAVEEAAKSAHKRIDGLEER